MKSVSGNTKRECGRARWPTRSATEMAEIRRGWVQIMLQAPPSPGRGRQLSAAVGCHPIAISYTMIVGSYLVKGAARYKAGAGAGRSGAAAPRPLAALDHVLHDKLRQLRRLAAAGLARHHQHLTAPRWVNAHFGGIGI
jgi:hypothetical protein